MIALFGLLLATAFPSTNLTSWMRPQSFHLRIGMSRADSLKAIEAFKPEVTADTATFDYSDARTVTLQFRNDRLHTLRFELFGFLHEARAAFDEEKGYLLASMGPPPRAGQSKSIVLYDDRLPNVIVVLSADPKSEQGQKGIGMLAVRYYDPATGR